jgi:type IV fimbrial biogenesis protein FimT
MFEVRSAIERGADRAAVTGKPFVGSELPLVGIELPAVKPFIGALRPFIGFWRFFGFTAIELLITIVIASILLSLALPSFRTFLQNNRLKTETGEFFAAINLARTEAKAQATKVSLCVSANQTGCTGGAWKDGWLVWVDADGDGTVDAGERILRARPAPDNGIVLTEGDAVLSFSASGAAGGATSFEVCDDTRSGEEGRAIKVFTTTGRARVEKKDGVANPVCS